MPYFAENQLIIFLFFLSLHKNNAVTLQRNRETDSSVFIEYRDELYIIYIYFLGMDTKDKKVKKVKVRGTATIDPVTNEFGFTPFSDGPSTQSAIKTCAGGGKRWTTTGSDPSKMFTLKTKESSPDQYADVLKQFEVLTRDLKHKKPVTLPDSQRVVSEAGLQCWLNATKGELTFTGVIDLNKHSRDWQAEVLKQVQLVVRRLPANERFNKVINNLKFGGNK